jgi:hypothetical protein
MVTQTSLIAYDHVTTTGKELSQAEFLTKLMIPQTDYSRMELAQRSGFPINVVTARVNKLIKDGRLEVGEQRRCFVTGHTINPVRLAVQNH